MPMTNATPSSPMQTRQLTARFLTPAFLGNAEQDGQWRTPPFKHLLREWWRVAWAEANGWSDDYRAMCCQEGDLFGSAAGESGHRSRVRMRLDRWDRGKLNQWQKTGTVDHPEVRAVVGADLYMGYGPLSYDKATKLKNNAAIQAGEEATLRLAFPKTDQVLLDRALVLMNAFGTLGGRSRNGWGSVQLYPLPGPPPQAGEGEDGANPRAGEGAGRGGPQAEKKPLSLRERGWGEGILRDWRDCLDRDWPHAIGRDGQGALVWQTDAFDDWKQLMRRLAEIKIGLRTQFSFHSGRNAPRPEERHWLSYPVTNHSVKPWDDAVKQKEAKKLGLGNRLPNTLRFKAVQDANGKLRGRIFHVPCRPPAQFDPDIQAIERVWRQVRDYLDELDDLDRKP